jgi:UDP-3-O-[3-hydroxymyristoyl] glucosamine N-acyltransferase
VVIRKTLSDLANHVGGKVIGDGSVVIHKVSPIDRAGPGEISFLTNPRYQRFLSQCRASAVIVGPGVVTQSDSVTTLSYLESADPYIAFAKILQLLSPEPVYSRAISAAAHIDSSAVIAPSATVFPNVYISARAHIGAEAVLFPGVYIGADVEVGAASMLHPNVVVRDGCRVGERVILHAGVVIGSDGFGYAGTGAGKVKIPQVGIVVVEDDVEIGANTTVDRATLGQTVIGAARKSITWCRSLTTW